MVGPFLLPYINVFGGVVFYRKNAALFPRGSVVLMRQNAE